MRHPVAVIIDNFHFIRPEVQTQILRALKDLIFGGLPVILVTVPHRGDDPEQIERELTGRTELLEIEPWSVAELTQIAAAGFEALNLQDDSGVGETLARESFSNPQLMQTFCLRYCRMNGIQETVRPRREIHPT